MKKKKNKMKKRISLIIATILAAGAVIPAANYVAELRAAASEPSLQYFATKKQFLDIALGQQNAETRIRFGYQNSGSAEWYIIGEDPNIKDDANKVRPNVILFSAQNLGDTAYGIGTSDEKNLSIKDGDYHNRNEIIINPDDPDDPDGPVIFPAWPDPVDPNKAKYEQVYSNHYGASNLRKQMDTLAKSAMFADVNKLILSTKLQLTDARNHVDPNNPDTSDYDTYTVDAQFYAPATKEGESLWFGSSFDVPGNVSASKAEFGPMWTGIKEPESENTIQKNTSYVFEKTKDDGVNFTQTPVSESKGIYPAFALDLSQVLFGSVVDKVSSTVTADTVGKIDTTADKALLLRLDGNVINNIGNHAVDVAYNDTQISYKNAPAGSRIVVQGKGLKGLDAANDMEWYWISGQLQTKGTYSSDSVANIVAKGLGFSDVGAGVGLDLAHCKIWLEDTANSMGGMPYAYEAHPGIVDKIVLTGVAEPAGDQQLSLTAQVAEGVGETRGIKESTVTLSWTDDTAGTTNAMKGAYGHEYTIEVRVSLDDGYDWVTPNNKLAENTVIRLENGEEIACDHVTGGEAGSATANVRTLFFKYKIPPNPVIEYKVKFDNVEVDPTQEIRCVYDGKQHSIEIEPITTDGIYPPRLSFESAEDSDPTNWLPGIRSAEDAGEYKIYFYINASDGMHNNVDATTDTSPVKPIKLKIEKRKVLINPESQEIPWTKDLTINQTMYKEDIGNQSIDPSAKAFVPGHRIVGLTLTPEMGAIINRDGIISEGWIWFYPTKKDDDGNEVPSYRIWDDNYDDGAGRDVTHNYDVQQGAAGKLLVLHNENLPPDSITVEKVKTKYTLGEALTVNDLKVTAFYGDGYSEQVPRGGGNDALTTNESSIDMTTLGGKELKVIYTREEPAAARGSASGSLTINVVEEEEPNYSPSPDTPNSSNSPNTPNTSNGTATTPNTTTRASNDPSTSSGTGSGTSSGTGTTSKTTSTTNKSAAAPGARTGDTNPIVVWVLAALCSGIVVVSLMIFNVSRGSKKRRSKK